MPLQVLPPGVTSLAARTTPNFNAPLISAPSAQDVNAFGNAFAAAALARDPRNVIAAADVYNLRLWVKSILGNSWQADLTLDDLMRMNPRMLYKAVALYLQGRYWGELPGDWIGDSQQGSPAFNWPNGSSYEQRIYTWGLKFIAVRPPSNMSYLAEDTNGAIYFPSIVPTMLIQKLDNKTQQWRVYNSDGVDRSFTLPNPGGFWKISGWDFNDWYATNADFAMVIKIVGFAVVAAAAIVSGGAALAGGATVLVALTTAASAAQTAQQIFGAFNSFMNACIAQDLRGALNGLAGIVNVSFGVDLKTLAAYQPGIEQIEQAIAPYTDALKSFIGLGEATGQDLLRTLQQIGQDAQAFANQSKQLLTQVSVDAVRSATGAYPDAWLKTALTMGSDQIGRDADAIMKDYTNRAKAAITEIERQVPAYLAGWKDQARGWVKAFGHDAALAKSAEIPWYGQTAFEAGTLIGMLEQRTTSVPADINALTPAQKRALFFGDIAGICAADPNCIRSAAEFLRQADLFWGPGNGSVQWWADYYKLRSAPDVQTATAFARR